MRSKLFLIIFIFFLLSRFLQSQGESAVPFLLIGPSGYSSGLGGAQTALPTHDTFGFFYNPAQTGFFARSDNLSFQYQNVDWLPIFRFSDLYFTATGITFGRWIRGTPLAIGLGYMRGYLNLGKNMSTDDRGNYLGEHNTSEWYDAFSLGLSFSWHVWLSAGFTYKSFVSDLTPKLVIAESSLHSGNAKDTAHDYGLMLHIPLIDWVAADPETMPDNSIIPVADLFLGMALNNLGDEVAYIVQSQKDPLPRQAKIGIAARLGLKYKTNNQVLTPLQISWTSEANDLLISRNNESFSYQSFPGDINFQRNILNGKGDERVINRHGFSITVFDMFTVTGGTFSGHGFEKVKTYGASISSRGIFKLLPRKGSDLWRGILDHADIGYTQTSYNPVSYDHPLSGTFFQNFTINLYGF